MLSSYQVETLSNVVVVLKPSEIDDYQKKYPDRSISALIPQMVTADVSVEVPNPDLSDDTIYEDVPVVNTIDFGFYVVPTKHDIDGYITSVDTGVFGAHTHTDISGYISSEAYISSHLPKLVPDPYSDGQMLSVYNRPVITSGDYSEKVTSECSLYPYKDPIFWRINPLSPNEFPDNVEVARD